MNLAGINSQKRLLHTQEIEETLLVPNSFPSQFLRRGTGDLHQLDQTGILSMNILEMNLILLPPEG